MLTVVGAGAGGGVVGQGAVDDRQCGAEGAEGAAVGGPLLLKVQPTTVVPPTPMP
jgi:hypothetical protein